MRDSSLSLLAVSVSCKYEFAIGKLKALSLGDKLAIVGVVSAGEKDVAALFNIAANIPAPYRQFCVQDKVSATQWIRTQVARKKG